jgi:DNA topoisomerase I
VQGIADADVLAVVAALKRRRSGSQLLAYRSNGGWVELHADDVNAYVKEHARGDFTAKDFRTWNASVLAAASLAALDDGRRSPAARERAVREAVKAVAGYLGNTPAVCRAAYIAPGVIDRFLAGVTIADVPRGLAELTDPAVRRRVERAVIELLSDDGT